jgi:hypothetical protein
MSKVRKGESSFGREGRGERTVWAEEEGMVDGWGRWMVGLRVDE